LEGETIITKIAITNIKTAIAINFNSLLNTNHIALYAIKRTVTHKSIVRKNKKRQRLSLEVLIKTNLTSLITALLNTLTNTLLIIKTTIILTQKKSLKKSFIHWLLMQV